MCKSMLKGQNVPGTDGTYHGTDGTCPRDRRDAHQGVSRQNSLCLLVFFFPQWQSNDINSPRSYPDHRQFREVLSLVRLQMQPLYDHALLRAHVSSIGTARGLGSDGPIRANHFRVPGLRRPHSTYQKVVQGKCPLHFLLFLMGSFARTLFSRTLFCLDQFCYSGQILHARFSSKSFGRTLLGFQKLGGLLLEQTF